jgi:hypothetical protein
MAVDLNKEILNIRISYRVIGYDMKSLKEFIGDM